VVGSVVLADLSGDRLPDIVATLAPHNGEPGAVAAWDSRGSLLDGFPLSLHRWGGGAFAGTPTVWDVDGDGDTELIAVTTDRRFMVWDTPGRTTRDVWPTEKGDMARSGCRPADNPEAVDEKDEPQRPTETEMAAFPNPFNRTTRVSIRLTTPGRLRIDLTDLRGRRIERLFEGQARTGRTVLSVDAAAYRLPAGLYLCRWRCGNHSGAVKLLYLP